jgi:hypothetical protein
MGAQVSSVLLRFTAGEDASPKPRRVLRASLPDGWDAVSVEGGEIQLFRGLIFERAAQLPALPGSLDDLAWTAIARDRTEAICDYIEDQRAYRLSLRR